MTTDTKDLRKVCFVIMGFGKKTDYESGRTLDLDATYEAIIKPVADDLDLRCIRADEILHSGLIDTEMFEMLFRADLVVADISTGNVNAIYELGVRHALRPNSTIIMKEQEGRLYFDLNHVSTFEYEHLGKDIGNRETGRARRDLKLLISEVLAAQKPDSPVYAYLPRLQKPQLSDEEFEELLDASEEAQEQLSSYMRTGEDGIRRSDFSVAMQAFGAAAELKGDDPYILQQLALATYKSETPSKLEALISGLQLIEKLTPEKSNDPETLGIAGAIRKRLWLLTGDPVQLSAAIRMYGRGYEVRRDYYNGENFAICYDFRSAIQTEANEALFDRMSAQKIRASMVVSLKEEVGSASFEQRSDRHWVYATLANCLFSLNLPDEAIEYEAKFLAEAPAEWELATYRSGKEAVLAAGVGK